jgi:hypothetical protein
MTERKAALVALRYKVKAEEDAVGVTLDACDCGFKHPLSQHINQAYRGSLDAAKALHEAVLPGWGWDVANVGACELECYGTGAKVEAVSFIDNPARAWLLAVLEALIAQEADQ